MSIPRVSCFVAPLAPGSTLFGVRGEKAVMSWSATWCFRNLLFHGLPRGFIRECAIDCVERQVFMTVSSTSSVSGVDTARRNKSALTRMVSSAASIDIAFHVFQG